MTAPSTIADVNAVFRKWLGPEYDLDAVHAVLATAAAGQLGGDPVWMLVVSGPGAAKTETIAALKGAGATVTSTISSEGALLSGSPRRDKVSSATGGLLRKIGARGILVIKDMTTILSMHRDTRAGVLAALREVHDGSWERNIGTNGGLSLQWQGHITVIGAVTSVWDRAHEVVAMMGDRFVLIRIDSTVGRHAAGRRAMDNTGLEDTMRKELSEVVGVVLSSLNGHTPVDLTEVEHAQLLTAADAVTLCRTAVEYDYRGNVIDAHAPEMPTRFAKQLAQIMRGARAIGIERATALRLAIRCARDSMPPLRLAIVDDVHAHPGATVVEVRRRLDKPRNTVDRQLQALHMLGAVTGNEQIHDGGVSRTTWRYYISDRIDPSVLVVPDLSPAIRD